MQPITSGVADPNYKIPKQSKLESNNATRSRGVRAKYSRGLLQPLVEKKAHKPNQYSKKHHILIQSSSSKNVYRTSQHTWKHQIMTQSILNINVIAFKDGARAKASYTEKNQRFIHWSSSRKYNQKKDLL